jgi:hypothetical protein
MTEQPIEIIFPTRNRIEKLSRALASINREEAGPAGIVVTVVCDGDRATAEALNGDARVDHIIQSEPQRGSVFCRNLATAMAAGPVLCTMDDIEFRPGAIAAAAKAMAEHFPDGDGVIGFILEESRHSPTALALVGQAFLQRYPGRRLFYPGYFHFACQELDRAAQKLGRLFVEPAASVIHYHPGRPAGQADKTHADGRVRRAQDLALSNERNSRGAIWGYSDFKDPNDNSNL